MYRSSTMVDESSTKHAVWRWGTAPDPGMGVTIELSRRDPRGEGDLLTIGATLAGVRRAAQASPPRLDHVKPAGADGNEDLLDARMGRKPLPDGAARVTREIVGDEIQVALRVVAIKRTQQLPIAHGVA